MICCFFNTKLTRLRTLCLVCSSTLTVVSDFTLCVRSGYPLSPAHAPESPLRLSLSSPRSPVVFIRSLHANYCNQTQVFLILHLTHLLTAVCLSPAADFAEPRPLATYPHRPTQAGKPSGLQPPPPPHFWRESRLQSSASPACGSS